MRTLGGYELLTELGRGAQGSVHRARHKATGAVRALKVIEGGLDPETVERFRREGQALARAGDVAVPVHEVGSEPGRLWLAMELCPGGSLADRLEKSGKLEWREAATLVAEIARGLDRAHELGLVHRDLKPANVLFDEQGRPRIADWGMVRDLGRSALTATGTTVGTPAYMAPEQLEGERVDRRADVFALGVILHELISAERPFNGRTWIEVAASMTRGRRAPLSKHGAPPELDAILDRALARSPAGRTPTAGAFARELDAVALTSAAPSARSPLAVPVAVAVTLAVAFGVVAIAHRERPADEGRSVVLGPASSPSPGGPAVKARRSELARKLETGADPVAAEDAPWELVGASDAEDLQRLAARRGVVYRLEQVEPLARGAATGSPRAVLEGLALLGTGGGGDSRERAKALLHASPVDSVAQRLSQALETTDWFATRLEKLERRELDVVVDEAFHSNAWTFAKALPSLEPEPAALVAAVLAPISRCAHGAAFTTCRDRVDPDLDLAVSAQRNFLNAVFDETNFRAAVKKDESAFVELVKRLPPALLAALALEGIEIVKDRHRLERSDGTVRSPAFGWGHAIRAHDPVLAAATLVRAVEERIRLRGPDLSWAEDVAPLDEASGLLEAAKTSPSLSSDDKRWCPLIAREALLARARLAERTQATGTPAIDLFDAATRAYQTPAEPGDVVDRVRGEIAAEGWIGHLLADGRMSELDPSTIRFLGKHPLVAEAQRRLGHAAQALETLEGSDHLTEGWAQAVFEVRALASAELGDAAAAKAALASADALPVSWRQPSYGGIGTLDDVRRQVGELLAKVPAGERR